MRALDLFSGCGGMSLGFQQAGFSIIQAFDNWAPAIAIYRSNFEHPIADIDLASDQALEVIKEHNPNLVMGGPPCQDYSIAGKRELGSRANLTLRFGELAIAASPTWIVFENVYNIERFPTVPKLIAQLRQNGYGVTTAVLDASKCGVPQKRRRYFLIARKDQPNGFLDEALAAGLSDEPMTVRQYLGDRLGVENYYMHPRSYQRRAVFSVDEPAATIRGINRPIPQNYQPHRGDTANVSEGVRALTTKERSLIQTFPEDFQLPGAKTNVELAIGNAVPPQLAKYIANTIVTFESGEGRAEEKHDVLF